VSAAELLAALRGRGVELQADGDRLRFRPVAAVTADELAALRAHKAGVLALLADLEALERDGTATRLRTIAATLTREEHERLRAEVATGDRLAELLVAVLAPPRAQVAVLGCRCGGIAWEPDPSGLRERCTDCKAWSPCSVVAPEVP
jgi:TubC N-terminal docking domain